MRAPTGFTPKYTSSAVDSRTPPSSSSLKIADGLGCGRGNSAFRAMDSGTDDMVAVMWWCNDRKRQIDKSASGGASCQVVGGTLHRVGQPLETVAWSLLTPARVHDSGPSLRLPLVGGGVRRWPPIPR